MAREHLLLNVENEEDTLHQAPAPMTRRQKWKNWWYYHKFHLLVGLVAIVIGGYLIYGMVTEVKPDYTIVMLSKSGYAGDLMENLGDQLSVYGKDRNGDGKVAISVLDYALGSAGGETDDAQTAEAAQAGMAKLSANLSTFDSVIFISDEASFERLADEGLYAYLDGETPEEGATDYENMYVTWKDCKGLSGAELSSEWYEGITPDDLQKLFGDCRVSLRVIKGTQYENDAGKQEYYADSQELLQHLIDGTPGQMKE